MKDVVQDAQKILQDDGGTYWQTADLLRFGNMGQREICIHKPEASTRSEARLLSPGITKQTLPADATGLNRVVRNMGNDGETPGTAITITDSETLDAMRPEWHSEANAYGEIKHFIYDPREPRTYYVWPKAPATDWYVEESLTVSPADCTIDGVDGSTIDAPLSIDDTYATPLTDYIIYRAYSMEAEFADNAALATAYFQAFANAIGITIQKGAARNPNLMSGAQPDTTVPRTPSAG